MVEEEGSREIKISIKINIGIGYNTSKTIKIIKYRD